MNKKIIIAAAVILIVLGFMSPSRHRYDNVGEVMNHLRQTKTVAYYFGKEGVLKAKTEQGECIYFRLRKGDFDKLCKQLEADGWKSEALFATPPTGTVWIIYGRNFPPFTVGWMKAHEKEAAAEANRLIWQYKLKRVGWFLGCGAPLLAVYLILENLCIFGQRE